MTGDHQPPVTSPHTSPTPPILACFRCWYSFGILFVFNSAFTDYSVYVGWPGGWLGRSLATPQGESQQAVLLPILTAKYMITFIPPD